MAYSDYVPTHERPVITALITAALATPGNTISVNDTEDWIIKRSTNRNDICSALGGTGKDYLVIRKADGHKLGFFYFIYDNGSADDPMVVICDYSANRYCDAIYSKLENQYRGF